MLLRIGQPLIRAAKVATFSSQLPDPFSYLGDDPLHRPIHDRRRVDAALQRHASLCEAANLAEIVGGGLYRIEDIYAELHEGLEHRSDVAAGVKADEHAPFPIEAKEALVFRQQELVDDARAEQRAALRLLVLLFCGVGRAEGSRTRPAAHESPEGPLSGSEEKRQDKDHGRGQHHGRA